MSRFLRSAGSSGGSQLTGDGSAICDLRTEWETLYQCNAVTETNWGCGLNWIVDTSKYFGFKYYLHNFCGDGCTQCSLSVGVYDSSGETCSCGCTVYHNDGQSNNGYLFPTCQNMGGGSRFRAEMCIVSSGILNSGWLAHMCVTSSVCCFRSYCSAGNPSCGMKWCDINSICFRLGQNLLTPGNSNYPSGGYLAVYGLKNPANCALCQVSYTITE